MVRRERMEEMMQEDIDSLRANGYESSAQNREQALRDYRERKDQEERDQQKGANG